MIDELITEFVDELIDEMINEVIDELIQELIDLCILGKEVLSHRGAENIWLENSRWNTSE